MIEKTLMSSIINQMVEDEDDIWSFEQLVGYRGFGKQHSADWLARWYRPELTTFDWIRVEQEELASEGGP